MLLQESVAPESQRISMLPYGRAGGRNPISQGPQSPPASRPPAAGGSENCHARLLSDSHNARDFPPMDPMNQPWWATIRTVASHVISVGLFTRSMAGRRASIISETMRITTLILCRLQLKSASRTVCHSRAATRSSIPRTMTRITTILIAKLLTDQTTTIATICSSSQRFTNCPLAKARSGLLTLVAQGTC